MRRRWWQVDVHIHGESERGPGGLGKLAWELRGGGELRVHIAQLLLVRREVKRRREHLWWVWWWRRYVYRRVRCGGESTLREIALVHAVILVGMVRLRGWIHGPSIGGIYI